jgi:uncharacterized protein
MTQPDFEGAKQFALDCLENKLTADLTYHNLEHTTKYVVPAVERFAAKEGVTGKELMLLITAAYYHDIGYIKTREEHEAAGIEIVRQNLPSFSYTPKQVEIISGIIMATRMPQSPKNLLEKIMADADLDLLGSEEFFITSYGLRQELEYNGLKFDDYTWLKDQLDFIQNHTYFTKSARQLRDEGKSKNIKAIQELLKNLKNNS